VLLFLSRHPAVRRRRASRQPILPWCRLCRVRLAHTRALRAAVARASPLVAAPATLRARVEAELRAARALADASRSRR